MDARMRKAAVALLAMAMAVALSALVLGCSSSSGASASASSSAGAESQSASAGDGAASSAGSSSATSEKSVMAASEEDSSEAAMGSAFVGTWDFKGSDGKVTFELNADGTGRALVYDVGSDEPKIKEPISWRVSSEETGSIWLGGNHPIRLVQNGEAFELNMRDLGTMGTFSSQETKALFYKR